HGTLLQIDAKLNLGCSGGALLNLHGELIGLTTAVAALKGTETPGGFAIPLDAAMRRIIEVLARGEEVEYGYLGVRFEERKNPAGQGINLAGVMPGSPADRAGLKDNDTVLAVNDVPVRENDDLILAVSVLAPGSRARLRYARGTPASTATVTVTLAKLW